MRCGSPRASAASTSAQNCAPMSGDGSAGVFRADDFFMRGLLSIRGFASMARGNGVSSSIRALSKFPLRHLDADEPRGVEAENVALRLLAQERQRGDGSRQVEIPMRPVRRKQQLRFCVDGVEGGSGELHV